MNGSKRVKSDDWLTEKYMDTFQRLLLVHLTFISSFIHSFVQQAHNENEYLRVSLGCC